MIESPMFWNGLRMNDQRERDYGLAIDPSLLTTIQIDAADVVSNTPTASIITDSQATLGTAVQDTQITDLGMDGAQDTLSGITIDQPGSYDITVVVRGTLEVGSSVFSGREYPREYPEVPGPNFREYRHAGTEGTAYRVAFAVNGQAWREAQFNTAHYTQISLGSWTFFPGDELAIRLYHLSTGIGAGVVDTVILTPTQTTSSDYWIKIVKVAGLWDGDKQDERQGIPGRKGELSGSIDDRGKSITISGEVRGRTLEGLRKGQRILQAAFADRQPHELRFQSWIDDAPLVIVARKNQRLDMDEEQYSNRMNRLFVVQVRADDPRAYSSATQSVTLTPGSTVTVTNDGTDETHPVTLLYGVMRNPVLTNLRTGEQIVWNDLDIAGGSFVQVDHYTGEVTLNGQSQLFTGLDVVSSDFFSLLPGDNQVVLTTFSSSGTPRAVVRWRNAFG